MAKLITLILFLLLYTIATVAYSKTHYGNITINQVLSIYDGDTFFVNINEWPTIIGHRVGIRINAIDTPEMRGKCPKEKRLARQAKQFTVAQLRAGNVIELKNMARGKYFRIIADVFIDGKNLGKMLMQNNLAVEYHGVGQKMDWCK